MVADFKISNIHLCLEAIKQIKNWHIYFFDLFSLIKNKNIIYKMREGTKYIARAGTTDRGIITTLRLEDEYYLNKIPLNKDSIVIDIGAQIGYFSSYVAKKAGRVFAFEPVPENYKLLLKNIKLNKKKNIKTFNQAVSNKKKTMKIFTVEDTIGHSAYGKGDFIKVQATSLKSIFDSNKIKHCDLIKMDIEGGEYDILFNLPDSYFNKIQRIAMECHDIDSKNNSKSMISLLKKKGFKLIIQNKPANLSMIFAYK